MAEETKTTTPEVVVPDVPVAEKIETTTAVVVESETTPQPEPEKTPVVVVEGEKKEKVEAVIAEDSKAAESDSFKEESDKVDDLVDPEKKALEEFKVLIQEALNNHEFTKKVEEVKTEEKKEEEAKPEEAKTEEKKEEEPKTEEPKIEEKKEEEPKTEEKKEEEPKTEEPKTEEPKIEEKKEEEPKTEEPKIEDEPKTEEKKEEVVAVEKSEEKTEAVAEEIKETIVQEVTAPVPAPIEEPKEDESEKPKEEEESAAPTPPEEVSIWGIKLLTDEKSDTILLKFLRARDFKVKEAFAMLKSVVAWRKEFKIDELVEEELIGEGLEKVVYMHGVDKEGHPVCYNCFGEFQDKELYNNTFADAEKREKFLRWYIQFLEKNIRDLDFGPDGISTIVQITDLKNSPGLILSKKELRQATNQALQLLQDNYPEFVAKQVFINVPWWYVAYNRMISPFLTQRTKSKFVFAGPTRTSETLFKYIAPEHVPVQYGGLSKGGEVEFTTADPATEEIVKPTSKQTIELPITEACTLVWEARVVGWDVSYGAEFVPSAEGGYTWIIQKARKIVPADEQTVSCTFKIGEPGKVVLTFDNQTSKKKKLLYRSKTKSE